jgi:predicted helicase
MTGSYLKNIAKTTAQGDAREESFYPHFSNFLNEFAQSIEKTKTQITTLPKKTEAGNPDFRVWDGKQHIVGYIEAKKPGENLDVIETTNQLKRYRSTFPNLILTDFYEFRLYRNGQMIDKVSIGRPFVAKKLKEVPPLENEKDFITLLEKFFAFTFPKVFTAESLATELAKRTGFLRDEVIAEEMKEEEKGKGEIFGFYTAFKDYLVANLTQHNFADIYSQTITYGLFAARTRANGAFTRKGAYDLIPQTIGILRDVFHFISLGKLPLQMEVIVDDIAEVLQAADVNKILDEYYHKGKGEDPIVHFYETFLNIYDPATREKRGVYYTPEPVVKYIVRSIHELLKAHFNLLDGLASKEVMLLDPAGGTLTFPAEAIKLAVEEFTGKYGEAGKKKFIKNHILKNFYAFELMMAPYAIGHIKISFLLEELGYKMQDDDRFKLYLTNTLDMEDLQQTQIPGLGSLSEESHLAGQVKKNEPILVIVGNPPYSIDAGTLTKEARQMVEKYKFVDEVRIKEKGALQFEKNLQNDFVKFIAFAQEKIQKKGYGLIAYINSNSYLDSPTLRGMRNSLMNSFDKILIIDLHGDSKKKEKTPDGGNDENVFDIQQGVSINFFIKLPRGSNGKKIMRTDLFGLRKEKYEWLENHSISNTKFYSLDPQSPTYFFKDFDYKGAKHYEKYWAVNSIFPVNGAGIITAHDEFVIDASRKFLEDRFIRFKYTKGDGELLHQLFQVEKKKGWSIVEARDKFKKLTEQEIKEAIIPILHRPFDKKFIMYNEAVVWSRSYPTMQQMSKQNIGLIIPKQFKEEPGAFVSDCVVGHKTVSAYDVNTLFPLYVYKTEEKKKSMQSFMLFEPEVEYGSKGKKPNIASIVFDELEKTFKKKPTPEQILYYCYAVLYSNIYREKYAEFLKIDFPRIPFTSDYTLFLQLSKLGEELAELHLLKHKLLNHPTTKYFGKGDSDKIEKPVYDEETKRVFINESRYFDNISHEVWNYRIGGYQVIKKYLDWRKGQEMGDPSNYCKTVSAIAKTIEVQKEIDNLFPNAENKIIIIE